MQIIRAEKRHTRDFGWLRTAWLFSFDEYYDPANVQFGALRVFNDDVVQPGKGFPMHPHREMEIVTIPLQGEITHEDSAGHRGVIGLGDVQRMSAGTGVQHSEMSTGRQAAHLYQIWFIPATAGLTPSYDARHYEAEVWHNRLAPIASGRGMADVVTFHTDATIFRAELDAGQTVEFTPEGERCVFLYLGNGEATLNDETLFAHDQVRITHGRPLRLHARANTHLLLIDLPPCA